MSPQFSTVVPMSQHQPKKAPLMSATERLRKNESVNLKLIDTEDDNKKGYITRHKEFHKFFK